MEVTRLALLLMDSGFGFRRAFDAASRMAGLSRSLNSSLPVPSAILTSTFGKRAERSPRLRDGNRGYQVEGWGR